MSERTVGVTGPNGFIAGHLIRYLSHRAGWRVLPCPRSVFQQPGQLAEFVGQSDAVVHLAGMNRGEPEAIYATNTALADQLVAACEQTGRPLQVVFASSTQRDRDNAYGRSKLYGEEQFRLWGERHPDSSVTNLVIPNVFGPGCRPHYNSVVATFCHELAGGREPQIQVDSQVEFVAVGEVIKQIAGILEHHAKGVHTVRVPGVATLQVSALLAKLRAFRDSHTTLNTVPDLTDPFDASLYTTYLSYLDLEQHRHRPQVHSDNRGELFEIIRLAGGGQVFFSTTKPGVIRGNHFHTRKIEWFCVLKGEAAIRLRRVGEQTVHEFRVSGSAPQFISIPALHTHQIENVGDEELLTMFWCNEIFVPEDADTYYEQVA
jgi:UDP-2-acetamido-2,6-beta-L-arabino-hexul-4-ose reductase